MPLIDLEKPHVVAEQSTVKNLKKQHEAANAFRFGSCSLENIQHDLNQQTQDAAVSSVSSKHLNVSRLLGKASKPP